MSYIKYKKIFLYLPKRIPCGGAELSHQFIDYLRGRGKDAYLVYGEDTLAGCENNVMECYNKYNIETTIKIEDLSENILILPETAFNLARRYQNIQIACWWMSVDNFVQNDLHFHVYRWDPNKTLYHNIRKWVHVMLYHLPIKSFDILYYLRRQECRTIHMYQSHYAYEYIKSQNLKHCFPLSDFINLELLPKTSIEKSKKEDIILYNPRKGLEYTNKVMKMLPNYTFVALIGMNRKELNDSFDKAKIYIDFGNFPGKDRMPREAVMHDCCIITGKNGASAFYEDVPIDDKYKFETSDANLSAIAKCIQDVMKEYEQRSLDFENYKAVVHGEQKKFYAEIDSIFG